MTNFPFSQLVWRMGSSAVKQFGNFHGPTCPHFLLRKYFHVFSKNIQFLSLYFYGYIMCGAVLFLLQVVDVRLRERCAYPAVPSHVQLTRWLVNQLGRDSDVILIVLKSGLHSVAVMVKPMVRTVLYFSFDDYMSFYFSGSKSTLKSVGFWIAGQAICYWIYHWSYNYFDITHQVLEVNHQVWIVFCQ